MFIERSSARIRVVRTMFVLLGVMPCAGLCGWAVLRHSAAHRRAIELRCERVIGMPVRIGRVEHVRPDAVRLHECVLTAADGTAMVAAPVVDVESSPTEVRVGLGRIACSPRLARAVAGLVSEWLAQPARFPRDCVVDVDEVAWQAGPAAPRGGPEAAAGLPGMRIECVAAGGTRAVRCSGGEAVEGAARPLEVRVMATGVAVMGGGAESSGSRLDVTGAVATPIPLAILEACAGFDSGGLPFGASAVVSGRIQCGCEGGQWSGTADGRIERIDLAAAAAHLPYRMSGEAALAFDHVAWAWGRVTACDCRLAATRGGLDNRLLESLVSVIGCRPGPEFHAVAGEPVRGFGEREFDEIGCRLQVGPGGIDLHGDPAGRSAIAVRGGRVILEQPPGSVPLERFAWLLSPPTAVAVPASKATRWLMGTFSDEVLGGEGQGRDALRTPSEQAVRPTSRSDF